MIADNYEIVYHEHIRLKEDGIRCEVA